MAPTCCSMLLRAALLDMRGVRPYSSHLHACPRQPLYVRRRAPPAQELAVAPGEHCQRHLAAGHYAGDAGAIRLQALASGIRADAATPAAAAASNPASLHPLPRTLVQGEGARPPAQRHLRPAPRRRGGPPARAPRSAPNRCRTRAASPPQGAGSRWAVPAGRARCRHRAAMQTREPSARRRRLPPAGHRSRSRRHVPTSREGPAL